MPTMIATKPLTYDMRTIKAGDEFEVADQYVGTLVSLGRARLKDNKSTKVEPVTTKPKEEPKKAVEAEDNSKYKTRQVKAEGDK